MPPSAEALALLRRLAPDDALSLAAARRPFPLASPLAGTSRLLITGCGHSGTHAVHAALRRHRLAASHEALGADATVGWPFAAHGAAAADLWPFRNASLLLAPHEPIFKLHRDPLFAVAALARGFTEDGRCIQRGYDGLSWALAGRFVSLPEPKAAARWYSCLLEPRARLRLALHYWVKWNLLADKWAAASFRVEALTFGRLAAVWCEYCARAASCVPAAARVCGAQGGDAERVVGEARTGHNSTANPVTWGELLQVEPGMAIIARLLAEDYGYTYPADPLLSPTKKLVGPRPKQASRTADSGS
ncbi:hypothetical protein AB1Y20_014192 [Prymnesium parvum]|uniref:Sulfotransferase n=1 Tax=Prymnesium parvum TaxID=97485 RepID=A0AB34IFI2_PRYPA